MSELGDFLKKLRGNLSLREAAKRSGLSYTYIRSLELGKHPRTGVPINPSPDSLRSLAKAYSYPHEELMKLAGYIDEEPSSGNDLTTKLKEELQKITGMPKSEERKKKVADFMQEFLKLPEETQDNFYDLIKNMPKK